MGSCSSCGSSIPDGQGSSCSMCYGDISHGSDGYYEEWARQQMEKEYEPENDGLLGNNSADPMNNNDLPF